MLIATIIENNIMYTVQEHLHTFSYSFSCSAKVISAILISEIFSGLTSTNLSTNFFCTYNLNSLNILQHHMIYRIHIHNYQDYRQIFYRIHLFQSILCIRICIYHYSTFSYYYKNLRLFYTCIFTFRAILCVLFHQFFLLILYKMLF